MMHSPRFGEKQTAYHHKKTHSNRQGEKVKKWRSILSSLWCSYRAAAFCFLCTDLDSSVWQHFLKYNVRLSRWQHANEVAVLADKIRANLKCLLIKVISHRMHFLHLWIVLCFHVVYLKFILAKFHPTFVFFFLNRHTLDGCSIDHSQTNSFLKKRLISHPVFV